MKEKSKIIINAALTGMVPTKEMTSHVPITPKEIALEADRAIRLGASIVHIHARDEEGKPTWKKEVYAEIISKIREKHPKVLITVSTSGRNWSEFEKRSEVLELDGDLKPDMATLTMGSMNFINTATVNSPEMIEKLAVKMQKNGIKPEFEIFETGMLHKVNFLLNRKIIEDQNPYFNLFFGNLGTAPLEATSIAAMLNLLPEKSIWAFAGLGRFQLASNMIALALGGNIRTGIEDNIYFNQKKRELASISALMKRVRQAMQILDLEISGIEETRERLGFSS